MVEKTINNKDQIPHVTGDMRYFLYKSETLGKREDPGPQALVRVIRRAEWYIIGVKLFFERIKSDIVFDFVQYIL